MKIVRYLKTHGLDTNKKNNDGWSPIHCASIGGNSDLVKYFVDSGVDVNIRTNHGTTPLMFATWYGHFRVVKYLNRRLHTSCMNKSACLYKDSYHPLLSL